jgi:flagellar motility protein MotE (MotC chaperone)
MKTGRAAIACLLLVLPLAAVAQGQAAKAVPAAQDTRPAAAAKAKLEASQGQAAAEGKNVKDLQKRVDALESNSKASREALEERDRKIAELERQLEAERHP